MCGVCVMCSVVSCGVRGVWVLRVVCVVVCVVVCCGVLVGVVGLVCRVVMWCDVL